MIFNNFLIKKILHGINHEAYENKDLKYERFQENVCFQMFLK